MAMCWPNWVQGSPVVRGFVFEWDRLTQIEDENVHDITWVVDNDVSLAPFLRQGLTADRMLDRPEKCIVRAQTAGCMERIGSNPLCCCGKRI
jgi:hypothetical protein